MSKRTCPECRAKQARDVDVCSKCGHRFLWRRTFGIKGLNRITVYERVHGGPIQLLWYDHRFGQHRETLRNLAEVPIYDKAVAIELAEDMATAQRQKREAPIARDLLQLPERHSVGELFQRLQADKSYEWSTKYARDQRRFRKFWEAALGRSTDVTHVNPSVVANAVRAEVERRRTAKERNKPPWSPKTQNHYLNAAVETWGYAERHLKWITPAQNLEAVKRHEVDRDNSELAYETVEVHMLLPTLEDIDLRAWACGEMSYMGGRRLTAIRTLPSTCYRTESRIMQGVGALEFGVVTFPARTDKAQEEGRGLLGRRTEARARGAPRYPSRTGERTPVPQGRPGKH